MERFKELQFSKKFAVVRYRGTIQANTNHEIYFESDDALEVMRVLEAVGSTPEPDIGYVVACAKFEADA